MKYLQRVLQRIKLSGASSGSSSAVIKKRIHCQWMHDLPTKSRETNLVKQLKSRIKMTGPITVAQYMQEVLSNPLGGYYMNRDVFGSDGDFITSPEISQMFGELIGIWFYDYWVRHGSSQNLQIVELGPGRGTLTSDVLRVFSKLGKILDSLSIHLVEISPAMKELQRTLLCGKDYIDSHHKGEEKRFGRGQYRKILEQIRVSKGNVESLQYITKYGVPVTWYNSIFEVPKGLSFYLAHEFFDALPIHQFQKTEHGWREIMVDIDEGNGPHHLKFCLAPSLTTAAALLVPQEASGDQLEARPEAQIIVEELAQNIKDYGGCSLIIDYGDTTCDRHTLRAFQNHKLVSPLTEPGDSDLTSNVDFSQLQNVFKGIGVETFGPVTQQKFLIAMGISIRRQTLLKQATSQQAKDIETAYKMLTDSSSMGNCFKFLTAVYSGTPKPPGF